MRRLIVVLVTLLFCALVARADDADEAKKRALERQAKETVRIFKKDFASKNMGRKMRAILEIGRINHDLVLDELGSQLTRSSRRAAEADAECRDALAQIIGDMSVNPEKAGKILKENLPRNEDFPEVQLSIIRSIGNLGYKGALEELKQAAEHLNDAKYQWVTVEVMRTFGKLEDARCLPFLLWMAEYGGHALTWATGSVTVDTGAAGDVDQRAAEKKWKEKYGHVKAKKPPAPIIRTYMDELQRTVKKITDQEFKNASAFRRWLIVHAKEYGLDPKKLTKK